MCCSVWKLHVTGAGALTQAGNRHVCLSVCVTPLPFSASNVRVTPTGGCDTHMTTLLCVSISPGLCVVHLSFYIETGPTLRSLGTWCKSLHSTGTARTCMSVIDLSLDCGAEGRLISCALLGDGRATRTSRQGHCIATQRLCVFRPHSQRR